MKRLLSLSIFVVGLLPASIYAMTLEEYLVGVMKKNKEFQSYDLGKEIAEDRRVAGDLSLSPVLTLDGGYLSDAKLPQTSGGTKLVASQYNVGLSKQYASGTSLGVTGNLQQLRISNPVLPTVPGDYSTGTLGVQIVQSLWKNSFGHGTRLRQERETLTATLEKESFNLKQRQILYAAESAYWDYLYLQEELVQKSDSLERAKRIEAWLKRRYRDGINDKADFLNAQALTASRELSLSIIRDQALASEKVLRDFLEMNTDEKVPSFSSDFKQTRRINEFLTGVPSGRIVRLDAHLSELEARMKSFAAKETKDSLRPDLTFQGSYATNSYSTLSTNDALSRISKAETPTVQLGIKLSYMFDSESKVSKEALSRKEALAAQIQSEKKALESESSWLELQRRYGELLKQIETAERLNKIQLSRAKELTLKLSRGRAVTSDVVTSEEEASSSSLSLNRMRAEARKIEAQSRLFIRLNQ
ncbi:MAG: TolC family protein [Bdellovibrionaceae bacterium]|nr:TolC family protein [Pseudobdellovibrionaceae bacterium]